MRRPTGIGRADRRVRNSRFIGVCGPAEDEAEARAFVRDQGEPDCRHLCWACRCRAVVRFDDAGEPGGTAGRPILAAIEHFNLDRVVVVVSRYFGGIKLGTGGLARAYGGTAMDAIASTPTTTIVEMRRLECRVPFAAAGELHLLIERFGATKLDEHWDREGLAARIEVPARRALAFADRLAANTRGAGSCNEIGNGRAVG